MAEAVTVAADARYTNESLCPARPLKFLVPVDIRVSPSPITPWQAPQHTEQLGFITIAPASINISSNPSFIACLYTLRLAGTTRNLTLGATFYPFITAAPTLKSSIRPLLQEPRNASSILTPEHSEAFTTLSTK